MKLSVFILTIMLIYAGVYSVMSIIRPETIVASTVKGATDKTLEDARSDGYLAGFLVLSKDAGIFGLSTVICGFFILFSGFRKARKWAWLAFLFGGGVAWIGGLVIAISIGDGLNILIRSVGAAISAIGLLIPIKTFFGASRRESQTDAGTIET